MYQVSDFMTKDPVCLVDSEDMFKGRNTMREHSIRHIPIIDNDKNFQGILTQKAVLSNAIATIDAKGLEKLEKSERQVSLKEVIDTDVITVKPDTSLLEAAKFFRENRHGCIAVLEDKQVVGILTSGDFVKFAVQVMEEDC